MMQSIPHTMNAGGATQSGRRPRRADHDLLRQINCIRRMAAELALADVDLHPRRQLYAISDMTARVDWAKHRARARPGVKALRAFRAKRTTVP